MPFIIKLKTRLQQSKYLSFSDPIYYSSGIQIVLIGLSIGILLEFRKSYELNSLELGILEIFFIFITLFLVKIILLRVISKISTVKILALLLLICFSIFLGYHLTQQNIKNYNAINKFYLGVEGNYEGQILELENPVSIKDKKYIPILMDLKSVVSTKSEKKIPAHGVLKIFLNTRSYEQENLQRDNFLTVKGKSIEKQIIREEGRLELLGRSIANQEVGSIYDAIFIKSMVPKYQIEGLTFLKRTQYNFNENIDRTKRTIKNIIETNLNPKNSIVLEPLIIGGQYNQIDTEILKSFSFTGLVHILSVSGSHVSLLFSFVAMILKLFNMGTKKIIVVSSFFIILYCCLVGFAPPMVRAAFMGILSGCAILAKRDYEAKQGLYICALLLLIYNPLFLIDVSFQLSFLATLGILIFYKPLVRRFVILPPMIRHPFVLCFSAQILLWPISIYYFHTFSFITFVANLLLGPILEIIILMGIILLLISFIAIIPFFWHILDKCLTLTLQALVCFASLRGGTMWLGHSSTIAIVLYYFLIILIFNLMESQKNSCIKTLWFNKLYGAFFVIAIFILGYPLWSPFMQAKAQLHVIPLPNLKAFIITKTLYGKQVNNLYLDTAEKELRTMDMMKINNSLHYLGVVRLKHLYIKNKSSDGINLLEKYWGIKHEKIHFNFQNENLLCRLDNGQSSRKNLKLNIDDFSIFLIADPQYIDKINRKSNQNKLFIYWSKNKFSRDIDPAETGVFVVGKKLIPTIRWSIMKIDE